MILSETVKLHMQCGLVIGSIVGHELAHGFDELRRHIDADGNHYSLWSQETSDMFDRRSTCIVEQYNNYTVSQIGSSVCCCDENGRKNFLPFYSLGGRREHT